MWKMKFFTRPRIIVHWVPDIVQGKVTGYVPMFTALNLAAVKYMKTISFNSL